MLAMNTLRHISQGYERLGKIQDQFASGKKITRPSQDPVIAMNGMRYRSQVVEVEQFQRNLGEVYNWLDNADSALDKTTQALHRIRELAVQASNDTYEATQRANIAKEIEQLFDHVVEMANTKSNGKYIFNGTNTTTSPIDRSKMDMGISAIQNYVSKEADLQITHAGKIYKDADLTSTPGTAVLTNDKGETLTINYDTPSSMIKHEYITTGLPNNEEFTNAENIELAFGGKKFTYDSTNPIAPNSYIFKNGTETITIDLSGPTAKIEYSDGANTKTLSEKQVGYFQTETLKENQIVISDRTAVSTNEEKVTVELLKGVVIDTNIRPQNVFNNALFGDIIALKNLLEDPDARHEDITKAMDVFDKHIDNFVSERAELGARVNRAEMIEERQMEQEVIAKRIMSNNEDADMEKVIIDLTTQESVHRAALAAGARIIQPTLMDFLR